MHSSCFGDILRNMEIEMPIQQCADELSKSVHYLHGVINIDLDQSDDYINFLYQSNEHPLQLTEQREQAARSIGRLYVASMNSRNYSLKSYTYQEQTAIGFIGGRTSIDSPMSLVQMTQNLYHDKQFTVPRFHHSLRITSDALMKLRGRAEVDKCRLLESYENLINLKSS